MTAITLGYTAHGRDAAPTVLYAGNDASAARDALEAPPAGIIRTDLILNPIVHRRRSFDPAAETPQVVTQESLEPSEIPSENAPDSAPKKPKK